MNATSGFLTASECTEFVFGRGSSPDPTGGAYSASPDPLAGLRGPASKSEERARRGERKKEGRGRGREGRPPPFRKFLGSPVPAIYITPFPCRFHTRSDNRASGTLWFGFRLRSRRQRCRVKVDCERNAIGVLLFTRL